jgi:hypothetical protein
MDFSNIKTFNDYLKYFDDETKNQIYNNENLISDLINIFIVYHGLKPSCLTNVFIDGAFIDEKNINENIFRREIIRIYIDILDINKEILDNHILNKTLFICNKKILDFENDISIFNKIINDDNKVIIKYNPMNLNHINKLAKMLGYYTRDYFGCDDHIFRTKKRELYTITIIETNYDCEIYTEVINPEMKAYAIQFYESKVKKINGFINDYGLNFKFFLIKNAKKIN